jgi:hypothetical protein
MKVFDVNTCRPVDAYKCAEAATDGRWRLVPQQQ